MINTWPHAVKRLNTEQIADCHMTLQTSWITSKYTSFRRGGIFRVICPRIKLSKSTTSPNETGKAYNTYVHQ